jgi:tetratricopeptide (TPR) repeat protein
VSFSPDGRRIATASEDGTARVWDAAGGQELLTLKLRRGRVSDVAFSPDGVRLATADFQRVRLWDAATGTELLALVDRYVERVIFSPDGRHLATAGNDGTARVWDGDAGAEILALKGHISFVTGLAFSPDGSRLASASFDSTARIWDASTGAELLALKGHNGAVLDVAFSPDGSRVATASADQTARIWDAVVFTPDQRRDRFLAGVVRSMWEELLFRDALLNSISADKYLDENDRQQALALAERYAELAEPEQLNQASWRVVSCNAENGARIELALRQADAACRAEPENTNYLNTLGVSQYRCGRYEDALKTLTRSDQLNAKDKEPFSAVLAFLAMTHHRLGNTDEAKAHLERLRERINQGQLSDDTNAFLKEAEALIEGKGSRRGHESKDSAKAEARDNEDGPSLYQSGPVIDFAWGKDADGAKGRKELERWRHA